MFRSKSVIYYIRLQSRSLFIFILIEMSWYCCSYGTAPRWGVVSHSVFAGIQCEEIPRKWKKLLKADGAVNVTSTTNENIKQLTMYGNLWGFTEQNVWNMHALLMRNTNKKYSNYYFVSFSRWKKRMNVSTRCSCSTWMHWTCVYYSERGTHKKWETILKRIRKRASVLKWYTIRVCISTSIQHARVIRWQ